MNFTPGGLLGYCSSKCMTSLKVPSSKGVSDGPMMTAFLYRTYQSSILVNIFCTTVSKIARTEVTQYKHTKS